MSPFWGYVTSSEAAKPLLGLRVSPKGAVDNAGEVLWLYNFSRLSIAVR
jgi:hypothetical protein